MNALILNGDLPEQTTLLPIQEELIEELESNKWDTEAIVLNQVKIKNCIGCFRCWHTTPGICTGIKGDEADAIIQKVIKSDLVIFLTPLTFGGYSSELKKIIGRLLGLLQPGTTIVDGEVHHLKRYDKYPSLLALGVTNKLDPEETRLFKKLVERHSRNFYPPKHLAEVYGVSEIIQREKVRELLKEMVL